MLEWEAFFKVAEGVSENAQAEGSPVSGLLQSGSGNQPSTSCTKSSVGPATPTKLTYQHGR